MSSFTGCLRPGWNTGALAVTSIGLSLTSSPVALMEERSSGVSFSKPWSSADFSASFPSSVIVTLTVFDLLPLDEAPLDEVGDGVSLRFRDARLVDALLEKRDESLELLPGLLVLQLDDLAHHPLLHLHPSLRDGAPHRC